MKEIVLPPHLYDRIKASAGEHGGIGRGRYFDMDGNMGPGTEGEPLCAHGHAWGTCIRMQQSVVARNGFPEPELNQYLTISDNDHALSLANVGGGKRIPFERWCELLNVKRGEEPRDELMEKRLEKSIEIAKARHAHV